MPRINGIDPIEIVGTRETTTDPVIDLGTIGNRIDLDTDNDSSIRASADDVITLEAGGTDVANIQESGVAVLSGRLTETLTGVDDDSQNMTLAVADIVAGINIHTSVSGGGTVTCDTGANIIAGVPLTADNQCVVSYYINDGNQTATFAVASGTTIANVANTVATNEAAILVWRRTSSSAVVLNIISS